MKYLLHLDTSGRVSGSLSRAHSQALAQSIADETNLEIRYRDLSKGLPFVNELMIQGYFSADEERTPEMRSALAISDQLVTELKAAERLVIGLPIYNFSVPASFKAWADLVARMGETFSYQQGVPVGLLANPKTHIVVSFGGTEIGSPRDHATPWVTTFLKFIGIHDIEYLAAKKD